MFVHEAAVFASDEEFLALVVPLLRAGLEAQEPTYLVVEQTRELLVRAELGDPAELTCLSPLESYADPLRTLRANLQLFESHAKGDASGCMRMVGDLPTLADEGQWAAWGRYESVVNHFCAALPVHALCAYDRRTTPAHVLADVERTHPSLMTVDASGSSDRYVEPSSYLDERSRLEIDELEATPPHLMRRNPSLVEAREAIGSLARTSAIDDESAFGLVLAVNEALANATAHGRPPAELRAWRAPDRIVVTVRDRGSGPSSPYVGLDRGSGEGRLGLWLSNQLCGRVTLTSDAGGFTVHLVAGAVPPVRRASA